MIDIHPYTDILGIRTETDAVYKTFRIAAFHIDRQTDVTADTRQYCNGDICLGPLIEHKMLDRQGCSRRIPEHEDPLQTVPRSYNNISFP